jgi:hypothetical protein
MTTPQTSLAVAPALYGKAAYYTVCDFTPITLTGMGVDLVLDTPEQFREYLKSEVARYSKVIRDAGIKAQ